MIKKIKNNFRTILKRLYKEIYNKMTSCSMEDKAIFQE